MKSEVQLGVSGQPFATVAISFGSVGTTEFRNLSKSKPEMLLVDEAHAARVHVDDVNRKPTKLWKLLNEIKDEVPTSF